MAMSFSAMTARRVDLARNLEAGLDNYRQQIAAGYTDFALPLLEDGETAPELDFHLELMKRGVARSRERLQSFESPVLEQTHEEEKVRAEIDRRQDAVSSKMRLVRRICHGIYGPKGVRRLGLKEEPERGAWMLYEQGKMVKESLGKEDLGLEPLIEIATGDDVPSPEAQMAAKLEPELSELGDLVGDRHEENRKGADVRSRRRRAFEDFDRDVRAIVRTAQGLFRLAGRDDLADRFRPILQRVSRKRKTESEPETSETTETTETATSSETSESSETSA